VPPLRERKEDIPVLAKWFLSQLSQREIIYAGKTFSDDSLEEMKDLSWSGNIRQLQNAVERMALLSDGDNISRDDVIRLATMAGNGTNGLDELLEQSLTFQEYKEKAERYYLIKKLEDHDWNVSATADAIDIQRSHIYNKMKKYDIER
jgi:DNA-binding NtrC family response regulator